MPQEDVSNVGTCSSDGLTTNFPCAHCKTVSALDFYYRPENRRQALEVVNSNFGQRRYASLVVPARPTRTCITIQTASGVHLADCTLLDTAPKRAKCRCELHEGCAHQMQTAILCQLDKLLGFAAGCC